MGCEIETKAHVEESDVKRLYNLIDSFEDSRLIGEIDKEDIYWAHAENDPPSFRTRREFSSKGARILFTSKPLKKKDYSTEYNIENEFECAPDQWDNILNFVRGLGFVVCRLKWKKGWEFMVMQDGFEVHVEILNVKFLGWFLEMEICGDNLDDMDKEGCDRALFNLLDRCRISRDAVEIRGFNKLLTAAGHPRG
ncbi:MAG: adenylate cyclase [Sphaerochaetaceae bacterium]|nr:adenylate cyclase [Sphaerochaetaceae bacterium]